MSTTPTYPGVYIEEISSGVHTITGVATSITAFIGPAFRGPVNQATTITSYADYERTFGGLWANSPMSYAVRDFFLNGGSQAIIVRLYHSPTPPANTTAKFTAGQTNPLSLEAASPGTWGNKLRARVEVVSNLSLLNDVATQMGVAATDLFNLLIYDGNTGAVEQFLNVTVVNSPRRIDDVLRSESNLVRVNSPLPTSGVPAANPDPTAPNTIWNDPNASTWVTAPVTTPDPPLAQTDDFTPANAQSSKVGLYALEQADLFNLLCIPPYLATGGVDASLVGSAAAYCEGRRAVLIVDPPVGWTDVNIVKTQMDSLADPGTRSKNAAVFFPLVMEANPLHANRIEPFAPSGIVAGVIARTDAQRGVWKASAGLETTIVGVPQLAVNLTDAENGLLNPLGVNCLRVMPGVGPVIWGARTLQGDDRVASEWKYLPIRRTALFIEESLYRGTKWVVFEPNDEPLWSQIRLNIGAFMQNLFRQGAFQGKSPREAYFVKCDSETTTQNDIDLGVVNIIVGFAPLKPAEFVIIKLQQMAGQIQA